MYYFASDIHLGAGSREEAQATEKLFVEWLDSVRSDATAIFLCGDIFDFWFEYKRVIPKGFSRTFGKLAQITDSGVRVVFMAGNHDMWIGSYLSEELGIECYTAPTTFEIAGLKVHIAHGDNLNIQGNPMLRLMNGFFRSKLARWGFSRIIHPDLGLKFGQWWSGSSRKSHTTESDEKRYGAIKYLKEYAAQHYAQHGADLYIFGHLHLANYSSAETPPSLFTNDWSSNPHYATISEDGTVALHSLNHNEK